MISTNDFKTGVTVEIDGDAWQVVEFQHVKPGKGAAFVRAKMRNLCTGAVVERTFNAAERLPNAEVVRREMQYLYENDGMYVFMDNETYEQIELNKDQLGSAMNFLKENMNVKISSFDNRILGVELPNTVELTVLKRNRASKGIPLRAATRMQPWTRAMSVKVPLFINEGDVLRIDTRTANTSKEHKGLPAQGRIFQSKTSLGNRLVFLYDGNQPFCTERKAT